MSENGVIEIYSKGEYPANALSNFSPHEFTFDGVRCASMEGFLQALKYRSASKQLKVCGLVGKEAKAAGKHKLWWKLTGRLYWKGRVYKRTSAEFDELRLRAYEALFTNADFCAALSAAEGCTLKHSMGGRDKRKTVLTEEEFIGYLERLREGLGRTSKGTT